jgi:large subunit ribosomal protein L30
MSQKEKQAGAAQQLRITLVRSLLGWPEKQGRVARALGFTKSQRSVLQYDSPIIQGMIKKIPHLLKVEVAQ